MKAFFKPVALMTASVATISLLSACGPKTPEQMIIGTWVQTEAVTMSEQGATVTISDSSSTYKKDGTSAGMATMTVSGSPAGDMTFIMDGKGSWSMVDGQLVEKAVNADIQTSADNPMAQMIAKQMKTQIESIPESTSEIIKLTKDELIVKDQQTSITMTYKRK